MDTEKTVMVMLGTIIFFVLLMIGWIAPAFPWVAPPTTQGMKLTMPDGTIIPIDGLDNGEVQSITNLMGKVARAKVVTTESSDRVSQVATDIISSPEKMEAWRKTITGTIKDICSDLNVTVNDFIKTPVGNGVVVYLVYNMIGKDVLKITAKVLLLIPFWCVVMFILFYLQRKYLSVITLYNKKEKITIEGGKTKTVYSVPVIEIAYPWNTNDARTTFAAVLYCTGLVATLVVLLIIFL